MTRRTSGDPGLSLDEGKDEETFRLARNYLSLHYDHEIDFDRDTVFADIQDRVPVEAPPPQSRLKQAWVSFSHAWRQVQWDWWTPLRNPYIIALIFTVAMAVATIAVIYFAFVAPLVTNGLKTLPSDNHHSSRVVTSSEPSIPASAAPPGKPLVTVQEGPRRAPSKTQGTRSTEEVQPLPQQLARNPANDKPLAIDITVGGTNGSLVDLNVRVGGTGNSRIVLQAKLGLAVDPAAAVCSLTHLDSGDPAISQLLAGLKAPVRVVVQVGPGNPLVVHLFPTGLPTQPLGCSMPELETEPGLPASSGELGALTGAVGKILGAVGSIPLLHQP